MLADTAPSLAARAEYAAARPGRWAPGPGRDTWRLAQSWDDLTPDQRSRAMQNFQRYQRLPEKGRERIDRRYQQFQGLPAGEQDKLRQTYDAYRRLSPDQRNNLGGAAGPRKGGSP